MFCNVLLETRKYEIISPIKDNDEFKAMTVRFTKSTFIPLNFDMYRKAKNTGN